MSDSRQVFIIGRNGLQNDLILEYIGNQIAPRCQIVENFDVLPFSEDTNNQSQVLALYDCHALDLDKLKNLLKTIKPEIYQSCMIALFNLAADIGVESIALGYGVRGFFYESDNAPSLLKGVGVLFSGDYWVSRKKIIECLVLSKSATPVRKNASIVEEILTPREIEILSQISMGEGNDAIAENLCISSHTVRTHIYNIFKKINVPNRLQASLWAAKHF